MLELVLLRQSRVDHADVVLTDDHQRACLGQGRRPDGNLTWF